MNAARRFDAAGKLALRRRFHRGPLRLPPSGGRALSWSPRVDAIRVDAIRVDCGANQSMRADAMMDGDRVATDRGAHRQCPRHSSAGLVRGRIGVGRQRAQGTISGMLQLRRSCARHPACGTSGPDATPFPARAYPSSPAGAKRRRAREHRSARRWWPQLAIAALTIQRQHSPPIVNDTTFCRACLN